ncbi:ribonuclease III [Candidatus Curtissbacteria bacterium]|nr:ribonuclease III [Candidatus Curtissbacteria bacterium]
MVKSQAKHQDLVKLLNITFQNKNLLDNAFIHRSYLNEHKEFAGDSNERLEFLGDSVLSLVVSRFLFENLPKMTEGQLTTIRASLVRTETLAKVGKDLNLGKYLLLSKGEEDSGGRENQSIMANTFEALIGAIYLDSGLESASKVIEHVILKRWKILAKTAISDHKSKLQEVLQRKYHISPTYKLLSTWGPDHAKEFEIGAFYNERLLGKGQGKNKQIAAQNAARSALLTISAQKKQGNKLNN